jgi:hypothetical protein
MYTGSSADYEAAARLLLDIAGPAPAHIQMSRSGPKKYYTIAHALTLDDAREHLTGRTTRGALCSRPDGLTRALAYDADDPQGWQRLQEAARLLAAAGYQPLLEPSPRAERGGHLWLIYTALVDAQEARASAHAIAPQLAQIAEYWPGPSGTNGYNRIRLPGGRYVARDFSAWCHLYDAAGQELARHGLSAARVLLQMQTPAELVPAAPARAADQPRERDGEAHVTPSAPARSRDSREGITPEESSGTCDGRPAVTGGTPGPGPAQDTKRNGPLLRNEPGTPGKRFLWFEFTPAQLARWFNERHHLDELHPREHGGMAFSPSVSERTPSTGYYGTSQGERWTDFSARARQVSGHPDGGDALELYVRLRGGQKASVLRELARELVNEARAELERAASSGAEPPLWVQEIMTPAGWHHYRELRARGQGKENPHAEQV